VTAACSRGDAMMGMGIFHSDEGCGRTAVSDLRPPGSVGRKVWELGCRDCWGGCALCRHREESF